jgi:hypothetical protein
MFDVHNKVDILNPTGEWVIAGGATIVQCTDSTFDIKTGLGLVKNVPTDRIQEARYICKGCEEDCRKCVRGEAEGETTLEELEKLSLESLKEE